jgi:hypothetical protein
MTLPSSRSISATIGFEVMSTRHLSTLRTCRGTPFGTARTFMLRGTENTPSNAAHRCSASRSTASSSFCGQMPRWSPAAYSKPGGRLISKCRVLVGDSGAWSSRHIWARTSWVVSPTALVMIVGATIMPSSDSAIAVSESVVVRASSAACSAARRAAAASLGWAPDSSIRIGIPARSRTCEPPPRLATPRRRTRTWPAASLPTPRAWR